MTQLSQAFLKVTMGAAFSVLVRGVLWDRLALCDTVGVCLARIKTFFLQMLVKMKFDSKPSLHPFPYALEKKNIH